MKVNFCIRRYISLVAVITLMMLQLHATIRYVKPVSSGTGTGSSWANASSDLNAMLFASANGDEVWVAAGTYRPTRDPFNNPSPANVRDKTFYIPEGVKLYGGFAGTETLLSQRAIAVNVTTLDGDIGTLNNNSDNSFHVVAGIFSINSTAGITIDGFTIKNGNGNRSDDIHVGGVSLSRAIGSGILLVNGSASNTIVLANNTITSNSCFREGAGIYISNTGSNTLSGNRIQDCLNDWEGGGAFISGGTNLLTGNLFSNNGMQSANGAGLCIRLATSVSMSQNTFTGNVSLSEGGGLYIGNCGPVTISNDTYSNNIAFSGGGIRLLGCGITTITSVNLSNNSCDYLGGGISIESIAPCSLSFINATGNTAALGGGGAHITGRSIVSHSIFNNNSALYLGGGIAIQSLGPNTLRNNSFTGNTAGIGGAVYSDFETLIDSNTIIANTASDGSLGGGGIYLHLYDNTVSNNTISGNSATLASGGGIYVAGDNNTIKNNSIINNTAGGNGGGIYVPGGIHTLTNNTITGNTSSKGGGIGIADGGTAISNNTITSNNAVDNGGGLFVENGSPAIHNNIFWANRKAGSSNSLGSDYENSITGINSIAFKNNLLQLAGTNYTATGSGLYDLGTAATGNIFNTNPKFVNSNNIAGPDGIDRTADDGLRLTACSPLINAGDNSLIPPGIAADITNLPRIQFTTVDPGAYEAASITPDQSAAIATSNLSITKTQTSSTVYTNDCSTLIAFVTSSGANPISGNTTARVWIESTPPSGFVKRHYEITPAANTLTATGRITLYFTQQDFTAFNTSNVIKLPIDATDAANNKANLRIEKRAGNTNNGTGLPASYTGSITTIDPADAEIVWNNDNNRWEVSFDVTGFSGFFVKTASGVLPLKWLNVNGTLNLLKQALLSWKAEEQNVIRYEIEKSTDGISFVSIGSVPGQGDGTHTYSFTESTPLQGNAFYRIKQTDADGKMSYSSTIVLKINTLSSLTVYPNPVKNAVNISSTKKQTTVLFDASGKIIQILSLTPGIRSLNTEYWNKGLYLLKSENGETIKIIKE